MDHPFTGSRARRDAVFNSLLAVALVALFACSSTPDATPNGGLAGTATAAGSAGVAAVGGGGVAAGGQVSSGGAGGSSGGGGLTTGGAGANTAAAGTGGGGGVAGAGAGGMSGCVEAGTPGKTGRQCEPGTMGDGTFDQVEPQMDLPPEAVGTPEGELSTNKTLQSAVYGYSFTYRTYKPTAYQAGKPAALMIFQDGGNYTGNFKAPRVFDAVIKDGTVPVTISVYIEPTGKRSVEYDTRSDKYGKMLTTELLPELAKTFDLVDDPNGWAIGGHSSGGSCAFNVAWWFTEKFHKVMTHSGSFVHLQEPGDDAYIDLVKTEPKKPIRVTLQSGTMDLGNGTWFNANNSMAMSLTTAGYPYRYMKSTTQHGPTKWHIVDFPAAMRWLWKGYSLPHYGPPK
jgi:enterochelin esterase-like enzyme